MKSVSFFRMVGSLGATVKQTQQYLCVVILFVSEWPDHQSGLMPHNTQAWRAQLKISYEVELISGINSQLYRNTPEAFHALINVVGGKLLDICIKSFV